MPHQTAALTGPNVALLSTIRATCYDVGLEGLSKLALHSPEGRRGGVHATQLQLAHRGAPAPAPMDGPESLSSGRLVTTAGAGWPWTQTNHNHIEEHGHRIRPVASDVLFVCVGNASFISSQNES